MAVFVICYAFEKCPWASCNRWGVLESRVGVLQHVESWTV